MNTERKIPAIPPEDYKGSQGDWHIALIERDLWDGEGWHGDVMIPSKDWWEILEELESQTKRTMKELGITKDSQEYLQEWEKQNNPFYPDEMRWDRVKVNTFLKDWKQQCNTAPSELLERYNEAIEVLQLSLKIINAQMAKGLVLPTREYEKIEQTISKAKPSN